MSGYRVDSPRLSPQMFNFWPTVSRLGSRSRAQIYHETNHYRPSRSRRGPQTLRFAGSLDSSLHNHMFLATASPIFSGVIALYTIRTIIFVVEYHALLCSRCHAPAEQTQRNPRTITSESSNPFPGPCEPSISDWNFSSSPINDLSVSSGSSLFCLCISLLARYWVGVVAVYYGLHVLVEIAQYTGICWVCTL